MCAYAYVAFCTTAKVREKAWFPTFLLYVPPVVKEDSLHDGHLDQCYCCRRWQAQCTCGSCGH